MSRSGEMQPLERAFGAFSRSLTLPDGINPDHVQARFDHGVLEVRIPKPEQKRSRQVQIRLTRSDDDLAAIEDTEIADARGEDNEPEFAVG